MQPLFITAFCSLLLFLEGSLGSSRGPGTLIVWEPVPRFPLAVPPTQQNVFSAGSVWVQGPEEPKWPGETLSAIQYSHRSVPCKPRPPCQQYSGALVPEFWFWRGTHAKQPLQPLAQNPPSQETVFSGPFCLASPATPCGSGGGVT